MGRDRHKKMDINTVMSYNNKFSVFAVPCWPDRQTNTEGDVTRPDTRLPKLRANGQGPYLRSPNHLGRSSEVKDIKSKHRGTFVPPA